MSTKILNIIYMSLLLVNAWSNLSFANELTPVIYETPKSLITYKMDTKQDAIFLLSSDDFKKELINLAKLIDSVDKKEILERENIALSSFLGQFSKCIAIIDQNKYPLKFYHYSLYANSHSQSLSNAGSLDNNIEKT